MTTDEVREAIREWFERRGVECNKNCIEFSYKKDSTPIVSKGVLITDVEGIDLPVKQGPSGGPYRE